MKNAILLLALTVLSLSAFANKVEQSAAPLPASAPAAVKLIQLKTNYVDHFVTLNYINPLKAKLYLNIYGRRDI